MVDLIVRTSLEQFLFILKTLFTFLTKQSTLMRRSTVLSAFPSVRIPWTNTLAYFDVLPVTKNISNIAMSANDS